MDKEKKVYEEPTVEIVMFCTEDIMTASANPGGVGGGGIELPDVEF